ncbi:hypothetical protein ABH925_006296 [Streptacidiphilus sp. EB129]
MNRLPWVQRIPPSPKMHSRKVFDLHAMGVEIASRGVLYAVEVTLATLPLRQPVYRALRRKVVAWAMAAPAALVRRRAFSMTKSWTIPW